MEEVTLVSPLTTRKWRLPPLGLLYVAAYLEKHGVSVRVLDPLSQGREDYFSRSPYTGITCMTNQFQKAKQIARKVKKENPETVTVFGGVHPSVATEEAVADPNIDVVIVGEGETAMLRILKERIRKGIVHGETVRDLDQVPFPARHLVNMDWYLRRDGTVVSEWLRATSMLTSRGCPFNCYFCINSKREMFGRTVRYHSPEYVEKEVEELVSKYGVEGIYFADDHFTSNKERLKEICARIKRFGLKWNCMTRVDALNRQTLEVMKDSGCVSIGFGVESGSQRVLNALNKNAKVEDAIKGFDLCHEVGVKTWASIIIGNPEETKEDIELTDRLLERIKPDSVAIYYLTPYRGTVIYDMANENGWIVKDNTNWFHDEPQMEINFTLDDLREIGKHLMRKHNSKLRLLRLFSKNHYVAYDILKQVAESPSILFEWTKS